MKNQKEFKEENLEEINKKEVEMANKKKVSKKKKKSFDYWFLEFLRWASLVLAFLFLIWLVKELGWIKL